MLCEKLPSAMYARVIGFPNYVVDTKGNFYNNRTGRSVNSHWHHRMKQITLTDKTGKKRTVSAQKLFEESMKKLG